ncbi:alpha-galactosidase [Fulvitalea axinellae]|uniref:Alpha-galactosidase n=1 Tax=Fulvitalea axinellae TaxID=1182444 RepID=A0AAU9DCK1_9BACT|nr:alpha-galactosidase [Fulvitalea axinellae]
MNFKNLTLSILALFITTLSFGKKAKEQTIALHTRTSTMVYHVNKWGKVYFKYLGSKLQRPEEATLVSDEAKEAYPAFGDGSSHEVALLATHADGSLATDLYYDSHKLTQNDKGTLMALRLKDQLKPFFVTVYVQAFEKENTFTQWTEIRHKEKNPVKLESFASAYLSFRADSYHLMHFNGGWAMEMQLTEEQLKRGTKLIETKRGVRATEYENPSFVLSFNDKAHEDYGDVMMGALAWSGNYRLAFQVDDQYRCNLNLGVSPFASDYFLEKGKTFTTPKMVYTYSTNGKGEASRNLHRWARNHALRGGQDERPVVLNSWEGAYFSFNEEKLQKMMDGAADMGIEMFVLDDGWFGNKYPRNGANAGLGDWQTNRKKLPNGLESLIDYAEGKGLKFGLWVEPEMVNPKSVLAETHPEWIIQREGRKRMLVRGQLLLDLSNPDVQDFVFNAVDSILTAHPRIAYIKWDANRHIQNFGSEHLPADRQSHLWIDYVNGLYDVYAKLEKSHPEVIFQLCASGGGRVDYGALRYHHEFWASDNTDALTRLNIQWGYSHFFPAMAMGAHVSVSPNHQTKRSVPLKFRFDVAMSGRLGMELQPIDLNDKEKAFAKKAIAIYKSLRPLVQHGDLYRIQSPYGESGYTSHGFVSPDKKDAVFFTYCTKFHRRSERGHLRLKGLDPNKLYRLTEINKTGAKWTPLIEDGYTVSGETLMKKGIRMRFKRPMESMVFRLESVENPGL